MTAPNNDAGSGGTHAPGSKVSGPYSPSNPLPGNGAANDSTTVPPTAGSANPGSFSSSSGPLSAKPGHPEGQGAAGSSIVTPGQ
jgi:hypothetical protein